MLVGHHDRKHWDRIQRAGNRSSRSGNDAHADDADIRPIYDEEPMVEVQTTAEINIFATGQQHTEQPEFNNEGKVDQNVEQCHDTCPLPAKFTCWVMITKTTETLKTISLNLKIFVSKDRCPISKRFLRMEAIGEAKKKTQESCRNSELSVMPSARSQSTTNGSKPKPRINNQKSRNWPASKSSCVTTKTVPIAEHSRNSTNSGLAPPRQMTSDHNSSELEIHDHSNELSRSKSCVSKVVPPADKTATSRQE
ncbi:hypothetical protein Tco_0167186 [Tanacetum coccineum]